MPLSGQSLTEQKAQLAKRKELQEVTGELSNLFIGQLLVKHLAQSAFWLTWVVAASSVASIFIHLLMRIKQLLVKLGKVKFFCCSS